MKNINIPSGDDTSDSSDACVMKLWAKKYYRLHDIYVAIQIKITIKLKN